MKRVDWISLGWLASVLGALAAVSIGPGPNGGAGGPAQLRAASERAGSARSVRDASGRAVPIADYRRIASASALADRLLVELAEPERLVAFSQNGVSRDEDRHRYGARLAIAGPAELERLLQARVDLLVVNQLGSAQQLARARDAGIEVFDLGEMRGLRTLEGSVSSLAELLGDRARGERLWQRFSRRMRAVAADVPAAQRRSAIYLAVYAGKFFGGTRGTSYHDVLKAAGLVDLAASSHRDWPRYDPEQLLLLDPPLVVTERGMARELCANRWLAELHACRDPARGFIELPGELLGDPGLRMLEAAEALHDLAYPRAASLAE